MKHVVLTILALIIITVAILTFAMGVIKFIIGLAGIGVLAIVILILWGTWKVKIETD